MSTDLEKGHSPSSVSDRVDATLQDKAPQRRLCGLLAPKKEKKFVPFVFPDPTPEEMDPFSRQLTPSTLYSLVDPKSYAYLKSLGGTPALLAGLKTDPKQGLSESTGKLEDRRRIWGENRVPQKKSKSFLALCWAAYTDKVLIVLSVAAVISLALGIYQSVGAPPKTYESTRCPNNTCVEASVEWVEGVAITIAIFIVVMVGSVNDWQKERQFQKLKSVALLPRSVPCLPTCTDPSLCPLHYSAQKEERNVKCIRNGAEQLMSVYDVLVGDILFVEPGEILPCDGVFLSGHNVRCDESGATGESDAVRKAPYEELDGSEKGKTDCFLISGSKVLEGVGSYVVTSVGQNSFHGKIMMSLQGETEDTPLQLKLNRLAELIAKLGSAAGLILFASLMIRFFVNLAKIPDRTADQKAQNFIQVLIISVTVVVVAVPEGLPLAVTLALAFATRRMTKAALLVRVLGACETMANATVICTDKTGTLTQNKMSVVAGSIGVHLKFVDRLEENSARNNANDDRDPEKIVGAASEADKASIAPSATRTGRLDFQTDMSEINKHLSPALKTLLNDSVVINSTAFEGTDEHGAEGGFVGSKTETALMSFAQKQSWPHYKAVRESANIVQMIPFSSERKAMGVVVKLADGRYRLYLKGASEVLTKLAQRHVVVHENGANSNSDIETVDFNEETRGNINRTIIFYACQSLRTIALCSRDFASWPPANAAIDPVTGEVAYDAIAQDLTLVAVTAIEDPLREGVSKAVATCQKAGVQVKMCTGDNVLTARSIASQCGIFSKGGIIMEGPVFRKLTVQQRHEIVPRLQVLARSSPEDKKILVDHLKSMGEVVGVTGDGTNDGPALKSANVGFSMGIAGTEVAKEASDIILMDDNFASIVSAIMWGRCVNDSVKKFLQFQLSVNVTAVVITYITAVSSNDEESVLTAVQLLWVNLIMDTFAALALATDPADPESLDRKPDRKMAPLISAQMWLMILGQAVYQILVALVLHFAGHHIFGFHSSDSGERIDQDNELKTLIFNSFVFCQIFNMLNARRLDRTLNIFHGIHKNMYFLVIFIIMVGGQALIVNFGGAAFQVVRISARDWAISIILGLISLPVAVLIRFLPPGPWERFLIKIRVYPDPNAPLPSFTEEKKWGEGLQKTIDNLAVYSQIRGGRARGSSIIRKSRTKQLREHDIHPASLMAMIPSMVMGSVGGGWRPEGSLADPAAHDPSASTTQLFQTGHLAEGRDVLGNSIPSTGFARAGHSRSASHSSTLAPIPQGGELTTTTTADGSLAPPSPRR
ncbi:BQ5605_C024g09849 [Microbotryum silenes-dioicae]|uniref:Calcium-transporting ATPase n=1 Tax=Microbotryum silenes-dioicae TaxID=796604 RepID=A0A2X0NEG1_9BASI|nr:BQ5605_C024g09849 [Microbotryum silenes-dioicae]